MKLQAETTIFNDEKVQSKFSELIVDADGIRTEVGTKVGNNEVISRINQSAESVKIEASKVAIEADNYITAFGSNGVEVHPKNDNSNYLTIDPTNGMKVYKSGVAIAQYGASAVIGSENAAHSVIDSDGQRFYASNGTTQLANIGYASGASAGSTPATAPYYSFGTRIGDIGNYSLAQGNNAKASGFCSQASGLVVSATGAVSHAEGDHAEATSAAAHAEGYSTHATGKYSHAEGESSTASGEASHAQNEGTNVKGKAQTVIGTYNIIDDSSAATHPGSPAQSVAYKQFAFIIGNGTATDSRSNALTVDWNGNEVIAGTLTQSSDKRLKTHIAYLDDDAVEFIRGLKPAHFTKDEKDHVGFYAQDVEKEDKWNCMTGEMNGYKTLGYTEIIAPLVAYCQYLEKRINELERK